MEVNCHAIDVYRQGTVLQFSRFVIETKGWDCKPISVPSIALGMDLVNCQKRKKTSF